MSECKACGLEVRWVRDPAAKQGKRGKRGWQCFNAGDGAVHWDTCSRERTRRALAEGVAFTETHAAGVHWDAKKRYMRMNGEPITGAKYTPSCGKCDVPPWEVCACSDRLAA